MGSAHKKADLPGRITLDAKWYIGNELVAYGRKPADHDPAVFQGIHARYVLVIIDEAEVSPSPTSMLSMLSLQTSTRAFSLSATRMILPRTSPRSASQGQAGTSRRSVHSTRRPSRASRCRRSCSLWPSPPSEGGWFRLHWAHSKADTMTTTSHIVRARDEINQESQLTALVEIVVEEVGVGAGVLDRLLELGVDGRTARR
jgi:hypothetical protein